MQDLKLSALRKRENRANRGEWFFWLALASFKQMVRVFMVD